MSYLNLAIYLTSNCTLRRYPARSSRAVLTFLIASGSLGHLPPPRDKVRLGLGLGFRFGLGAEVVVVVVVLDVEG
jgi:hypothetical protein